MESPSTTAQIVDDGQRRDRRGRVSWPRERREELLAEYARSGMSQAAFARRAGVRYPTFAHWVQEARRESSESSGAVLGQPVAARFAEVRFAPQAPAAAMRSELSVTLPSGLIARGADAVALAALVRALWVQA